MSRFGLLVLLLSLLVGYAVGGTMTYSVYSDSKCQSRVSSGSTSTTFASDPTDGSGYVSSCFPIYGVAGASSADGGCLTLPNGVYGGALITYSDSNCQLPVGEFADIPPGTCSNGAEQGYGSAVVACSNGAASLALVSVPLLAALSVLASLVM